MENAGCESDKERPVSPMEPIQFFRCTAISQLSISSFLPTHFSLFSDAAIIRMDNYGHIATDTWSTIHVFVRDRNRIKRRSINACSPLI